MKIAIVLTGLCYPDVTGGMEIFAYRLANELGKKGHQVYLLALSGSKLKDKTINKHFEYWLAPFKELKAQPFLFMNLLKIKPDVCLAISFPSSFSIIIYNMFFHTQKLMRYAGTDAYKLSNKLRTNGIKIEDSLGNKLRTNRIKFKILNCILFWFVKRQFINISLSRDMAQALLSTGTFHKLKIVPNGIDEVFFNFKPNYNGKIVGFVGRLEYIKGCDILLKAFSIVKKTFPDLKIILVGKGSQKRELIFLARKLGIQDSVIMRGLIAYEQIPLQLSKFSLFVLPSRSEGMPNALLQAMAMSLPVIGSRVGGIPDLIDDKVNGLLVTPEDPYELAKAIMFFLENKTVAKEMAMNARIKAKNYRISKIVSIYENLLNYEHDS